MHYFPYIMQKNITTHLSSYIVDYKRTTKNDNKESFPVDSLEDKKPETKKLERMQIFTCDPS